MSHFILGNQTGPGWRGRWWMVFSYYQSIGPAVLKVTNIEEFATEHHNSVTSNTTTVLSRLSILIGALYGFSNGLRFFSSPLTELSILGYVEHPFIIEIGYSTFARNTLTPPLPPSPITSLSLHPASFPYSLVGFPVPCGGFGPFLGALASSRSAGPVGPCPPGTAAAPLNHCWPTADHGIVWISLYGDEANNNTSA